MPSRLELDLGFHYSAGDYDTSSTTEIYYVTFTIRGGTGVAGGPSGPVTTSASRPSRSARTASDDTTC